MQLHGNPVFNYYIEKLRLLNYKKGHFLILNIIYHFSQVNWKSIYYIIDNGFAFKFNIESLWRIHFFVSRGHVFEKNVTITQ